MLVGVDRWGQPTRTVGLLMEGQHPTLQHTLAGRAVSITSPLAINGSALIYRWTRDAVLEPFALDGGPIYHRDTVSTSQVHLIPEEAYKLDPGIKSRLQSGATGFDCVPPEAESATEEEMDAETRVGPRLCSWALHSGTVVLEPPDDGKWGLWAIAIAVGLQESPVLQLVIEATCAAPALVPNADAPSCREGSTILSGNHCTPSCAQGYTAVENQLACQDGTMTPSTFSCEEDPCLAPEDGGNRSSPTCLEGAVLDA
eukprot:2223378-Amphidinium_carterae.1